jgi:hypothetical protein
MPAGSLRPHGPTDFRPGIIHRWQDLVRRGQIAPRLARAPLDPQDEPPHPVTSPPQVCGGEGDRTARVASRAKCANVQIERGRCRDAPRGTTPRSKRVSLTALGC